MIKPKALPCAGLFHLHTGGEKLKAILLSLPKNFSACLQQPLWSPFHNEF
jgi:hypothetical protein